MKEREIEEMRQLRRSGSTFDQISDKTQYSINTVKKYCKGIKRGNGQAGKALMVVTSNPLLAIQDLGDLMQGAMATGVSLGSGIEAIHRGFTDESLSDEDRMLLAMKGGSYLTGIAFGAVKTLQDLAKASKPPVSQTVKSPEYEDLAEKVKELEEKNKDLEKQMKLSKNRKTNVSA